MQIYNPQRWSGCGPYQSLSIKIPGILSHVHTSISSERYLAFQVSSLKKHHPTATHCPSHKEPHFFTWPRGAGTLKHTHLYNSMTGFATSLYCLSLAATASGLSSSCWTNGSPVTSSIPCKYQRNPQQCHSGPLNIPKTSFFLKLEFLKWKTNVSKNQMASLGKTLIKEKVCQSCFCYFQILSRSSSKIKLTQVILANQIMTSKVRTK